MRGLLRVQSYTAEPEQLATYCPLIADDGMCYRLQWAEAGIARVFVLAGGAERVISERTSAAALTNRVLFVARANLPLLARDEYYSADLVGLDAFDPAGHPLGTVCAVHDFGGGICLEIDAQLVPFTQRTVPEIDLARRRLVIAMPAVVGAR